MEKLTIKTAPQLDDLITSAVNSFITPGKGISLSALKEIYGVDGIDTTQVQTIVLQARAKVRELVESAIVETADIPEKVLLQYANLKRRNHEKY